MSVSSLPRTVRAGATSLTAGALLFAAPAFTAPASAASASVKALHIAAKKKGAPYRWGATGPRAFDCSGLVQYAFRKAGKKLPRTAAQQYRATKHVKNRSRIPGDLVFFTGRGGIYHVGIYAGHGRIWESPRPGRSVHLAKIWSSRVLTGRVR